MIELTSETLKVIGVCKNVILEKQAVLFQIDYPVKQGWFNRLLGKQVSEDTYRLAYDLSKQHKLEKASKWKLRRKNRYQRLLNKQKRAKKKKWPGVRCYSSIGRPSITGYKPAKRMWVSKPQDGSEIGTIKPVLTGFKAALALADEIRCKNRIQAHIDLNLKGVKPLAIGKRSELLCN